MSANNNPGSGANLSVASSNFVLMATQRPAASRGQMNDYLVPINPSSNNTTRYNARGRWFSPAAFKVQSAAANEINFYDGLISQNNPAVKVMGNDGATPNQVYYEDPDGICRRATGAYVPATGAPAGRLTNTTGTVGLPMATAGTNFAGGIATPNSQSQSRPIILHRPFRTVGEMSYAFRGTPWKNIDFFTPESGDVALLDVFCVNEPPSDAMVAGKVNLNTRRPEVLQAVLAGGYRDEWDNLAAKPASGTIFQIPAAETANIANALITLTSAGNSWRGPLINVADLVGHFVPGAPAGATGTDVYRYVSPPTGSGGTFVYAGFSSVLGDTSATSPWLSSIPQSAYIQRMHEAPIRALADCGQTRVWNLLIDVVAQAGRYPPNANTGAAPLANFSVEGEKRYWVHVAIDRFTGEVIDKQLELVTE
jgi:hypothetical protein